MLGTQHSTTTPTTHAYEALHDLWRNNHFETYFATTNHAVPHQPGRRVWLVLWRSDSNNIDFRRIKKVSLNTIDFFFLLHGFRARICTERDRRGTREEGEEAMEVTAREGPRAEAEGARVLVQSPWRTCHTPTFSSAGARRCLPELSKAMFESTDAITPKAAAGSYRRYAFTIAGELLPLCYCSVE